MSDHEDEHDFGCGCERCTGGTVWAEWDHHGGTDTVFAVSGGRAAERVTGLVEVIRAAEHELMLTVGMWKLGGGSWQDVADTLSNGEPGTAGAKDRFGATKQAASQRFRAGADAAADLLDQAKDDDDEDGPRPEFLRLARAIGAKPRPYSYELHTARAGSPRSLLSTHRKLDAAERAAMRFAHDLARTVYVVRVDPRPNQRPKVIGFVDPSCGGIVWE